MMDKILFYQRFSIVKLVNVTVIRLLILLLLCLHRNSLKPILKWSSERKTEAIWFFLCLLRCHCGGFNRQTIKWLLRKLIWKILVSIHPLLVSARKLNKKPLTVEIHCIWRCRMHNIEYVVGFECQEDHLMFCMLTFLIVSSLFCLPPFCLTTDFTKMQMMRDSLRFAYMWF